MDDPPCFFFKTRSLAAGFLPLVTRFWSRAPGCLSLGRPAAKSQQQVASDEQQALFPDAGFQHLLHRKIFEP